MLFKISDIKVKFSNGTVCFVNTGPDHNQNVQILNSQSSNPHCKWFIKGVAVSWSVT